MPFKIAFSALTLFVGRQEVQSACKNLKCCMLLMVIWLELDAILLQFHSSDFATTISIISRSGKTSGTLNSTIPYHSIPVEKHRIVLLGVYTVRSSDRPVGPTGRSDPGYVRLSVRPVGQTGWTDCSRTAHMMSIKSMWPVSWL